MELYPLGAENAPPEPAAIAVNPEGIPDYLKKRPQWVLWRYEKRSGKETKIPYSALTGTRASSTDLLTWSAFEAALAVYRSDERYHGVGFVFCSGDPFAGIDLDGCRDPKTGALEGWAQEVIAQYPGAYVEASPSGKGIHIITRAKIRGGKRKGPLEVYDQDRYFTISGVPE